MYLCAFYQLKGIGRFYFYCNWTMSMICNSTCKFYIKLFATCILCIIFLQIGMMKNLVYMSFTCICLNRYFYLQVHELLRKASHNRAVAETKCNERSSRSHSVFRLKISGINKHTQEACTGRGTSNTENICPQTCTGIGNMGGGGRGGGS